MRPLLFALPCLAIASISLAAQQPSNPKPIQPKPVQPATPPVPPTPATPTIPTKPGQGDGGAHAVDAMAEHMKEQMAMSVPGPFHKKIAKYAGEWDESTTMEITGQPAQTTKGTVTIKSELGGRFVHEMGSGDAMGFPTQSFKAWGYNNGSRKFEGVWTWTNSTGLLYLSGQTKDAPDALKSIDWDAWFFGADGKREEFKVKTEFTDDNHMTYRIYGGKMPDGSPGPTMTTVYTRKK